MHLGAREVVLPSVGEGGKFDFLIDLTRRKGAKNRVYDVFIF
jgi:hypothetical protein